MGDYNFILYLLRKIVIKIASKVVIGISFLVLAALVIAAVFTLIAGIGYASHLAAPEFVAESFITIENDVYLNYNQTGELSFMESASVGASEVLVFGILGGVLYLIYSLLKYIVIFLVGLPSKYRYFKRQYELIDKTKN